jgi:hypothetical protein
MKTNNNLNLLRSRQALFLFGGDNMPGFLKSDSKQRYTLGVVYSPDEIDSQGDFADAAEIEKACHGFMRRLQGRKIKKGALGHMHKEWPDDLGEIVECYCAPIDMQIGDENIKKGTWLLGVIWNDEMFQKIEKNEITGYSMGGTGNREEVHGIDMPPVTTGFQKALSRVIKARGDETAFQRALKSASRR